MKSETPLLSIIIPSHRGGEKLESLLASISTQNDSFLFETIVVANPPNAKTADSIKKITNISYLETKKIGANHARNIGLNMARGKVVLFVDEDCFCGNENFVAEHIKAHESKPNTAGIGGAYLLPKSAGLLAKVYHQKQMDWVQQGVRPGFHADLLFGGNMSFKKELLDGVSFDEKISFGGTETNFIFELAARGKKIELLPTAGIEHHTSLSFFSFVKKAFMQGGGGAYLKEKKYYGNALVCPRQKGAQSGPILLNAVYQISYQAGFRYKLLTAPGLIKSLLIPAIYLWEIFSTLSKSFKHLLFVQIWGTLEAAVYSRKTKDRSLSRD